jgi:hypothetical protein
LTGWIWISLARLRWPPAVAFPVGRNARDKGRGLERGPTASLRAASLEDGKFPAKRI